MRLAEEEVEGDNEPTRIFPRRPLEWVLQIMGVFILFIALLILANLGVPALHSLSLGDSKGRGAVEPIELQANMLNGRRRLLNNLDFLVGNRKNRKIFLLPQRFEREQKEFYPYNISGSYTGFGRLTHADNGSRTTRVTSGLRIRTSLAGSRRYHIVQIKVLLASMIHDELHENVSLFQRDWFLDALGIYDLKNGRIQAIANSPTFPPKLPMFKNRRSSYHKLDWSVSQKVSSHPMRCPFFVDASIDEISRNNFLKENGMQKRVNHHEPNRGTSIINVRKYIDVHLKVTLRSMNDTCSDTNITQAIISGDLLRYDMFILKTLKYALIAMGLSLLQVLLVYRQMKFSTPPNVAVKFSLASVAMHSVLDAYLSLLHLMTALYIDDLFYPFIMVFLFQFLVFSVFDLRFVLLVWRGRWPLDFTSGWERVRSTLAKIYLGFYGGMLLSLILLYYVRNRMSHVVFLLFAFWVPQIVHNIKTGDKFAVQGWFLFGVTSIRLFFPLYAYGCPNNFLEIPTDPKVVVGLLVLAGMQMLVLKAQDRLGSRFFIPKRLQPNYYDYHRTFQIDPVDYETCAICMADIVSSTVDATNGHEGALKESYEDLAINVLTTPCNHRFCQQCLIKWMETKMSCPTCRRALPPYNL